MNIFLFMNILKNIYNTINFKCKNELFFLIVICHKSVTKRSQNSDGMINPSQICDEILILSQNSDGKTIPSQFCDRFVTDIY